MRSTTFDMVGMALMAVVTILTIGGMLTWAYLKENRGHPPLPVDLTSTATCERVRSCP